MAPKENHLFGIQHYQHMGLCDDNDWGWKRRSPWVFSNEKKSEKGKKKKNTSTHTYGHSLSLSRTMNVSMPWRDKWKSAEVLQNGHSETAWKSSLSSMSLTNNDCWERVRWTTTNLNEKSVGLFKQISVNWVFWGWQLGRGRGGIGACSPLFSCVKKENKANQKQITYTGSRRA